MQHAYRFTFLLALAGLAAIPARAQSLVSGFMSGKGNGSVVVSGTTEQYQNVFIPAQRVASVPLFKQVRINSVNLYANYGLTDKIDVVVSLPYIHSQGDADAAVLEGYRKANPGKDYTNTRSGLQDVAAYLKFKTYSREIGTSFVLNVMGAVGVSTPASNYETKTGAEYIIAIGNRATKLTTMGIAQLKSPTGLFVTGQAGYSLRSGRVPNAFVAETKLGYAGRKIYADAYVAFQESHGGLDIVQDGFDLFFPATRVNYTRVGGSLYRPIAKGLGVVAGASVYVAGRNLGKSKAFSAGLSYNF